jgi:hypothetical protein
MADETKKQFLDSTGLSHFWGIIKSKFAVKNEALKTLTVTKDDTDSNKWTVGGTYADGSTYVGPVLPTASTGQAGLMTKEQVAQLNSVVATGQSNVIEGISLDGTPVELKDKIANIGLVYETSTSEDGKYTQAFISLVDKDEKGTAISKIDVTELTKTGLLADSDLVINPEGQAAGTYLKLTFNVVDATNGAHTQTQYINVTKLIDIYTGGEGIKVNGYEISIEKASDSKLGGVKTGYTGDTAKTYAVKVDGNGNAYVAVNWGETVVANADESVIKVEKTGTTGDVTTYTVSAGTSLTSAIGNANSALQTVSVLGVDLTKDSNSISVDTAKEKLGLKGAAYVDVDSTIGDGSSNAASSSAVKSYVDGEINAVNGLITDITKENGAIDTAVAAGVSDAVNRAKSYTDTEIAKFVALTNDEITAICV